MQAPTTGDDLAAQEPERRPCPACGAENTPAAAFCWQCYRSLLPPPPSGSLPPQPAAWPPTFPGQHLEAPRSRSRSTLAVTMVAVAIAVSAAVALVAMRSRTPSFPETFGGLSRVQDSQVEAAIDSVTRAAERSGVTADMAVYGAAGSPEAMLMWVDVRGLPGGVEEGFGPFTEGMVEGSGGSIALDAESTATVGGVAYTCAPMTGAFGGGVCMWEGTGEVIWVLMDLRVGSRIADVRRLAVDAHQAG